MHKVEVRKRVTVMEEVFHEGGPAAKVPLRRAATLSVIHNPFAGKYVEEIAGFMEDLNPLGLEMAKSLVAALGGDAREIEGYGKGAIVGQAGEIEHGALWHVPGGYAMREILGNAKLSWHPRKKWVGRAHDWTCPSRTSTLPTCAAILMRWKSALRTLRARMKFCWRS